MVRKVKKDELYDKAKDLRDSLKKKYVNKDNTGFNSTACFGMIGSKGEEYEHGDAPCHWRLKDWGEECTPEYIVTLNQKANNSFPNNREALLRYYDYLCNRSPWSGDCITTDPEEALDEGMIFRCDREGFNITQGCIVATRQPWEHGTPLVEIFSSLVALGVEEDFAFLFASFCQSSSGLITLGRTNSGHYHFNMSRMGVEEWKNFIAHKKIEEVRPYAVNPSYAGVHKAWGDEGNSKEIQKVLGDLINLPHSKAIEGWGEKVVIHGFKLEEIDKLVESFDKGSMFNLGLLSDI